MLNEPETTRELAPAVALRIAIQAIEAALESLEKGNLIEVKDALWDGLAALKQR